MQLELLATWSKKYTDKLPFDLPEGWQLATHQKEVYDALHDSEVDVVFDTAMTGDGKTLAAYLPMLRPSKPSLGKGAFAYPTNELIRDQARQMQSYLTAFDTSLEAQQVNSAEIDRVANMDDDTSRYAALEYLMYRRDVLLTNPDIFNLIQDFAYVGKHNPATLAQQFSNRFRYLVFDEFHVFSAVQVASILDALLFISAGNSEKFPTKFLFLSATPSQLLTDALDKADIRYRIIKGDYQDDVADEQTHRKILQYVKLEITQSDASSGGILGWCERNLEDIKAFYARNPDSKGLMICNSVFTAKKLHAYLREALADTGITLGENTGLTGQEERNRSLEQDLVVATSTVDVGVDFRINFLVFESLNAGSFIQRLGRLGRHKGFGTYKAISLLPQFIVERFEAQYQDRQKVSRWTFFQSLSDSDTEAPIFPKEQTFDQYITRWGGVKVLHRLGKLARRDVQEKHAALVQAYQLKAAHVFRLTKNTLALANNIHAAVNQELHSFRGAGLTDVWLYEPVSKRVSSIDIARLLAGTEFRLISKAEAQKISDDLDVRMYPPYLGLYAVIEGYHDEYEFVNMTYDQRFDGDDLPFNHAVDRVGFQLEAKNVAIGKINDALLGKRFCTCVCDRELSGESPRSVRQRLRLPPLFNLVNITDDGGANYTVAFGQDALLLDSLIYWRKINDYEFC